MNFNLFLATRRLTRSKEDHLTEFLAGLISTNKKFNQDFSQLILGEFAKKNGWKEPLISTVETQISYPGTTCRPDMLFVLEDGHIILCENKIDAPETMGQSQDPRGQLKRYLDLPTDGLAYIRSSPDTKISSDVLSHSKFIGKDGHHFLWRDIYPLLKSNKTFMAEWVKKGFEVMGFTPAHPVIGTLSDFNSAEDAKNRQQFVDLWQPCVAYGKERGWRVEANKHAELYFTLDARSPVRFVFASPSQYERFLVRLSLRNEADSAALCKKIESVKPGVEFEILSYPRKFVSKKQPIVETVIDISSTLNFVIGEATTNKDEISGRLISYVKSFMEVI